jgi:hypothetical protein
MVLADSDRVPPAPPYSGFPPLTAAHAYRTVTSFGLPFQVVPLRFGSITQVLQPPEGRNLPGLGSFPFARHYLGNHNCFLLLHLLRCFSSVGSPPFGYLNFIEVGCPIRIPWDQYVFAVPPRFSQLTASFIAVECLGIPRIPFLCSIIQHNP